MQTAFQRKVWAQCRKIPKGRVSTYKAIAKALKCKSFRAVGQALNASPGLPEVPCHRIVYSNGGISGFAFGKKAKKSLLKKEGLRIAGKKNHGF